MAFVDEEIFYDYLKYRRENTAKNAKSLTKQKYDRLVNEVKYIKAIDDPNSSVSGKKTGRMFWVLKAYDVIEVNGEDRLICPNEKYNGKNYLHYIHDNELFDIIKELHESDDNRHIGRDRMMKEINQKYKNITRSEVALYLMLCKKCQPNQKAPRPFQNIDKSISIEEIKSRCSVDVLPIENQFKNNIYKYLMIYTNFIIIRPLKTNQTVDICNEISDIFGIFGAPTILESCNGQSFVNQIILNLMNFWDGLKLINGNLLKENLKNSHQDIFSMIELWIKKNPQNDWHESLKYIQFVKNCTISSHIKSSPYQKTFNCEPKFGLRSTNLHEEIIETISTEKDLDEFLNLTTTKNDDKNENDIKIEYLEVNSNGNKFKEED